MEIRSRFRNLYIFKTIFGYLIVLFCISICLKFYLDVYSPKRGKIAFYFLIGIIVTTVIATIQLLRENKILVKENEMIVFSYFSMKKVTIKFTDIIRIERRRIVQHNNGVQISEGYYESEIILNDGPSIVITPDKFENYKEIISTIKDKVENN